MESEMSPSNRSTIAIINDDPAFLQLLNDILEAEGPYDVFPFRDRETRLEELRTLRPDLIVIDILVATQPTGWEIALLAGADQKLGPIPIIVSSPNVPGLGQRVDELLEVANVRVLSKPFTLEELRQAVHMALAQPREPGRDSHATE